MKYLFFILILLGCPLAQAAPILVSIAPQKYLAKRIVEDRLEVQMVVPPGMSAHTFEPSPKQAVEIQKANVWFLIGESFERKVLTGLDQVYAVDQREGLSLIYEHSCHCAHHSHDPHIWLSCENLKKQACQMSQVLCELYPEYKEAFEENLALLLDDLGQVDHYVQETLATKAGDTVIVSHPAFGYFCRDYHLKQRSIEMEGKEPTAKYLLSLLQELQGASVVFVQKQHNTKGGECLAKALDAEVVYLDPYKENVLENLKEIADAFYRS